MSSPLSEAPAGEPAVRVRGWGGGIVYRAMAGKPAVRGACVCVCVGGCGWVGRWVVGREGDIAGVCSGLAACSSPGPSLALPLRMHSPLTCRNPNVAKRAQISADAGDAPAEYASMEPNLTLAIVRARARARTFTPNPHPNPNPNPSPSPKPNPTSFP